MASIIKAHIPALGEVWCGITGRVPGTPLNVLRWKSNLLTFKKRLSSLFLLNFECDIGLICHCGAKRDKFWIKGKFTFSHLQNVFSFTNVKVPVCLFVSTRENVVTLWIQKKAKWNKMRNNFKLFRLNLHLAIFIHNLGRNTRKIVF